MSHNLTQEEREQMSTKLKLI